MIVESRMKKNLNKTSSPEKDNIKITDEE